MYPEPWMFGTIPAKGFYLSHAKNISFQHIHFYYDNPDGRPLFVTKDTSHIRFMDITENGETVSVNQ